MLQLLLLASATANGLRPSGPPPGGRVLPEGVPVAPRGAMQPKLTRAPAAAAGSRITSRSGVWLDEPSPPLRDANGTYHMFATSRPAAASEGGAPTGYVGAQIVHFQAADLASPWTGGEVVLRANATGGGWDSGGVFAPGAAFNPTNGTWSLFYSGVSAASPTFAWLGLASSVSPSAAFRRAYRGAAVVRGYSPAGASTNHSDAAYIFANGAIPAGGDLGNRNTTVAGAELHCNTDPMCKGFTFEGADPNPPAGAKIYFKRMGTVTDDKTWQSYTKKAGPATLPNATVLRHARPLWKGGKAGSAKGGHVAVSAIDRLTGDATLNLFGLQQCHDRTCDHPVFEWSDSNTNLKPFGNNPMLGV